MHLSLARSSNFSEDVYCRLFITLHVYVQMPSVNFEIKRICYVVLCYYLLAIVASDRP